MPTWTRLASSCTLVLAAWSWYLFTQDTSLTTFSLLIAIGMTLGCIGDLLLAELFPLPQPALGGMAAFGLGHIAYIVTLLLFGNQYPRDAQRDFDKQAEKQKADLDGDDVILCHTERGLR